MSAVHARVKAGGEHYAVPVENVLEISELGDVAPVPGAPPSVLGARNLRGQVISVVDLASVIGIADDSERERVVVAEEGGRRCGIAVSEIVDVGDLEESLDEDDSPYLKGTTLIDGQLVGVVDVSAVFDAVTEPVR
jgi:purine-binding chemotaxis protein CheW